ncbi:MFS transporter [Pseudonocardiaceae bacterium YIM PH 21723]|nr:MFS transporter [Pseudonocardiaceae bacterium YIM PH 21723]
MRRYRELFRIPGLPLLTVIAVLGRLPMTARVLALTVYTVAGLGQGTGRAGLVVGLMTLGIAVGAPLWGACGDRFGLRPAILITGLAETAFWLAVPQMSYSVLVSLAPFAGMLAAVTGQFFRIVLSGMVPVGQRRPAFSMEATLVEVCFTLGPATWMLVNTATSTPIALRLLAGMTLLGSAGFALFANPPDRIPAPAEPDRWLTRPVLSLLLANCALLVVVLGTTISVIGILDHAGHLGWAGLLTGAQALYSAIGGLVYGTLHREFRQHRLLLVCALSALPLSLVGSSWWALGLALIPVGLCTAPGYAICNATMNEIVPPEAIGRVMGLVQVSGTLGASLGSMIAGFAMDEVTPAFGPVAVSVSGLALLGLSRLVARTKVEVTV